ncbi:hypothetical protein K426_24709 [Sphingobium sp. TKS]|nr:hypothetical protein K426_24709 [Sphingobium sp. TKS]
MRFPPRAGDWLWRPWYAKLWWGSAIMFWSVFLSVPASVFPTHIIVPLGALLHPFVIIPVLGFGFFRAWFGFQFKAEKGDGFAWSRHDDSHHHFATFKRMDPTDPANSRYYGHPGNPTSQAWLDRHVRGKH